MPGEELLRGGSHSEARMTTNLGLRFKGEN
jgi:hypothetical protein